MLEALSHGFIQQAIIASILASLACGIIGTLIVLNRMTFLAGGVAHAAYGGVGLALFAGWPMLPCTMIFSGASALIMSAFSFRHSERSDAAIGVLWAAGMAFGILLMDFTPGYRVDLMSFLFGSLLTVPLNDLFVMAAWDVLLILFIVLSHQSLTIFTFDRDFAAARGLPIRTLHALLTLMAALTIVLLIRLVGLLLVVALLTIPPLIVRHFLRKAARGICSMMALCALLTLLFCIAGLIFAYIFDLTTGAAIIGMACIVFFLFWIFKKK
jgi:zinc transport system permease protein